MSIKTIIELQAKAGQRDELVRTLNGITATMQEASGFLGFSYYEVLGNPDGLVEIVEWESPEARKIWIERSMENDVLEPLVEVLAAPYKATHLRQIS